MLYLNKSHIENIGIDWNDLVETIGDAVKTLKANDYSQPVKPYLRYGDPRNRIIAMPAYIGGEQPFSGIKWIASFPGNIMNNIPRAHSVSILNQADTGIPLCMINTTEVSAIRTASVSGLVIKECTKNRKGQRFIVGIVGFGPIGRMHLRMIASILANSIEKVLLYDLRGIDMDTIGRDLADKITICGSWEECYETADIFIACTVAEKPYINRKPKRGSLQLNVSLRDYEVGTRKYMDIIVVDDWDEVCRQNTDIENMHIRTGLMKEDTVSVIDLMDSDDLSAGDNGAVIMFNPMGMAVFDIAIGGYYYRKAIKENIGVMMPE
jgi:2,3-diaminopropionate biosynthesis protein SbnB